MNNFLFYKGTLAIWQALLLGYCLLCLSFTSLANSNINLHNTTAKILQQTVTGIVGDASGPLPGVSISIKGTTKSVTSGADGIYTILAGPADVLVFSYIGYSTIEFVVGSQPSINITLIEDATTLEGIEINAGYYSVKNEERTGSIAQITTKDIEKQPVSNPLATMQGRMSGVNIIQSTGTPGGGFTIQVRGTNSIRPTGNEPLYIINGVPYASQSLSSTTLSNNVLAGTISPLNNINPNDIESIEVLKDADATAIYGSRGANGVVLITTKNGKAGKTRYTINSSATIGKVTRFMDLMDTKQFLSMRREAFANDGIIEYPDYEYDINGAWDQNRNTNWQKEFLGGTSHINNVQATISGGSETTQFLLSGTYRRETTVFSDDSNYQKGAVHSSLTHSSTDKKFELSLSTDYIGDKNTLPGIDLTNTAYTLAPNAPAIYDATGALNWENSTFENPLSFYENTFIAKTQNLISNAVLSYKIMPGWVVKANLGYNDNRLNETRTLPYTRFNPAYGATSDNSSLSVTTASRTSWIIEPQIGYTGKWREVGWDVLAGTTFQQQKSQQLSQSGAGFISNSLINNLAAATRHTILNHDMTEYKYNAFFARFNLNWDKRYIINLTGRRDGSSRFGPGNRFANFGAVGAAWAFSKEAMLQSVTALSFGKLRASYGTSGNDQIGDYQFLDTYRVSGQSYAGVIGITPTRLFNPDFGWETNRKFELAIEAGFLKDRIFMTTAYFRNRSSSQLVGIPQPATTGFSILTGNLDATVQNTGFEIDLRSTAFQGEAFSWTTSINLTVPKNKLVAFPGLTGSTYANTLVVGESINVQKLYHYIGISPETGTYQYEDYNNDGKISADDRKVNIDTAPALYGGFSNVLTYKNWTIDFLFQFVKQKGENYIRQLDYAGSYSNQPTDLLNHWPQNGTNAINQIYTSGSNNDAVDAATRYKASDASITDASFIRLKSAALTYTFPASWSRSLVGKIYLQGQNLLTITNYKGADPENHSGLYLPPLRQITLGVQISF